MLTPKVNSFGFPSVEASNDTYLPSKHPFSYAEKYEFVFPQSNAISKVGFKDPKLHILVCGFSLTQ